MVLVSAEQKRAWDELGGAELQDALGSGSIALLDVDWLIQFASTSDWKNRIHLSRRQELPPEAFVSVDQLRQGLRVHRQSSSPTTTVSPSNHNHNHSPRHLHLHLPIICLSYCWLHPEHPDPHGTTLRLVGRWCEKLMQQMRQQQQSTRHQKYGLFWDYGSLFQKPRLTKQQNQYFQQGLNSLATLYSAPFTICFQVKEFPADFPDEYKNLTSDGLGHDAKLNAAPYHERGWPFVENCWISTKNANLRRDISEERAIESSDRREQLLSSTPPLTPSRVWDKLQTVSFTNRTDDLNVVHRLYKAEYAKRYSTTTEMQHPNRGWGDQDIVYLAEVLADCPRLHTLNLSRNLFQLRGCQALAQGLAGFETLRELDLSRGNFDQFASADEGVKLLAEQFLQTNKVDLRHWGIGAEGCQYLAMAAAKSKRPIQLQELSLDSNPIGDDGLKHLLTFSPGKIRVLGLTRCDIGTPGCQLLAETMNQLDKSFLHDANKNNTAGAENNWVKTRLDLGSNNQITARGDALLDTLEQSYPHLLEMGVRYRSAPHPDSDYWDMPKSSNGKVATAPSIPPPPLPPPTHSAWGVSQENTPVSSSSSFSVPSSTKEGTDTVICSAPPGALGLLLGKRGPNNGHLVAIVSPKSPLSGKVKPGDELTKMNSTDLTQMNDVARVKEALQQSAGGGDRLLSFLRRVRQEGQQV